VVIRQTERPPAGSFLLIATIIAVALFSACLAAPDATAQRPLATGITTTDVSRQTQLGFKRVRGAGASFTRVILFWRSIAPSIEPGSWDPTDPQDPNYNWSEFDRQIRLARNAGLQVLASIYQAPEWAERCRSEVEGICNPNPRMFADFAEAAARRYSGDLPGLPRIRFWKPWNEPNLFIFFLPQFRNGKKVSPGLYRALLNRFSARIKAVDRSNVIVGGGLAPLERPGGLGPLDFMRRVLCLQGRKRPGPIRGCRFKARFDVWANNPYTTGGPFHSSSGIDDVSLGDLREVPRVLRAGKRYRKILTRNRSIPLWVTEFSWDSKGPDPGGVPMNTLRKWVPQAMHQAWKAGVSRFFWLSLRDWPRQRGLPFSQTYESGLYFRGRGVAADRPKPILGAFRFPFVAYGSRTGLSVWGRTPDSRRAWVRISYRFRRGWRNVGVVRAGANGVFAGRLRSRIVTPRRGLARARLLGRGSGQRRSLPFSLRPVRDYLQPPFG
jgi:hypothetical protein